MIQNIFVPADVIESKDNSTPGSNLKEKLWKAIRRHLSNNSFTNGYIKEQTPLISIKDYKFDITRMGYYVNIDVF